METLVRKIIPLSPEASQLAAEFYVDFVKETCALSSIPIIGHIQELGFTELAECCIENLIKEAQYSRHFILKTLAGVKPTAQDGREMLNKKEVVNA